MRWSRWVSTAGAAIDERRPHLGDPAGRGAGLRAHVASDGDVVYVDGGAYPCPDRTGQHGVWRSADGGRHWTKTASVTGTHVAAGDGRVAIADQRSVRVSANGSAWDLLPALPDSATVGRCCCPPTAACWRWTTTA